MEEYRDTVRPKRSRFAADVWYLGQVGRLAWRIGLWGLALSALYVTRITYDWFVPTTNFAPRAEVTTLTMVSTLLVIGASSTLRTRSVKAGIVSTASALAFSAVLSPIVLATIYATWNNAQLLGAIERSGGLVEALAMPAMLVGPGTLVGAIGSTVAHFRIGSRWGTG